MKIGILTFHCANNYGAVLQTYGLQEYLKTIGYEVCVIDYCPFYITEQYKTVKRFYTNAGVFFKIKLLLRSWAIIPIRYLRNRRFQKFRKSYLNLVSMTSQNLNRMDVIIVGSDQIWNSMITKLDSTYFGKIPGFEGRKTIAYAASVGNVKTLFTEIDKFKQLIGNCTAISVREQSLQRFFYDKLGVTVPVVLDPVLLAGSSTFVRIASKKHLDRPYLLVFMLNYDIELHCLAEQVAKQKHLILLEMVSSAESLKERHILSTESPNRFISLFMHADYVITSSFHGTVFALLFQKNFNVVSHDTQLADRMLSLLTLLGLQNRFFDGNTILDTSKIDYKIVNDKLNALRIQSQKFIDDALS